MAQKAPRLYKWLNEDGSCIWGRGAWPLPTEAGKLGAWLPMLDGELRVCRIGYHAFEAADLVTLMPYGPVMLVEVRLVRPVKQGDKWLAAKGRVVRVVFACGAVAAYERIAKPARAEYERDRLLVVIDYPESNQQTWAEYERNKQATTARYRATMAELLDAAGREPGGRA